MKPQYILMLPIHPSKTTKDKEDNKSKSYQLNKLGQNTYKPQKT